MLIILFLLFICSNSYAQSQPVILQIKYSPWGKIFADEEEFDYGTESEFEKYNMRFERGLGLRAIATPYYISAQRSVTNIGAEVPDTTVETLAIGFGGILYDPSYLDIGTYLIGAVGVGAGKFEFKEPSLNDWEAMFDCNAEVGFRIAEHMLMGTGIDYQLFGEPGETKAHSWTLYISTGIIF